VKVIVDRAKVSKPNGLRSHWPSAANVRDGNNLACPRMEHLCEFRPILIEIPLPVVRKAFREYRL